MGENGGRTTGQLLSHGPCAGLAWCLMSLAHIQREVTAGLAVSDDGDGRCRKIPFLQGCYTKGYSLYTTNTALPIYVRRPSGAPPPGRVDPVTIRVATIYGFARRAPAQVGYTADGLYLVLTVLSSKSPE